MTSTCRAGGAATFRSLHIRNFRLFFIGQLISQSGTWMTMIAQTLLVLEMTGSGVALGALAAAQFGPILIMGAWTGTVSDRVDKQHLFFVTEAGAMLQSIAMGLIVLSDNATVGVILGLAAIQGVLTAFDSPARRSFVLEMVPVTHVANAVSLNTTLMTGARVIGPAAAGAIVSEFGFAWCFLIDALSYVAVLCCLGLMKRGELFSPERARRTRGQIREGLRYVRSHHELYIPIVMVGIIGVFAFNFSVSIPLLITGPLRGSDQAFTSLFSVMSVGSVVGALGTARRQDVPASHLIAFASIFGATLFALALAPSLLVAYPIALTVGAGSVGFMTSVAATVQLRVPPNVRGRVLALQSMVVMGSTPIGGPIIGWISDAIGARAAVFMGGLACVVAAGWGRRAMRHQLGWYRSTTNESSSHAPRPPSGDDASTVSR